MRTQLSSDEPTGKAKEGRRPRGFGGRTMTTSVNRARDVGKKALSTVRPVARPKVPRTADTTIGWPISGDIGPRTLVDRPAAVRTLTQPNGTVSSLIAPSIDRVLMMGLVRLWNIIEQRLAPIIRSSSTVFDRWAPVLTFAGEN